jgi:hypothetical protein
VRAALAFVGYTSELTDDCVALRGPGRKLNKGSYTMATKPTPSWRDVLPIHPRRRTFPAHDA